LVLTAVCRRRPTGQSASRSGCRGKTLGPAAEYKALTHTLPDGSPAHSFGTLLEELATIVRNTCRVPGADSTAPTFQIVTTPNTKQKRALELLNTIAM
jgi:hypothetical protein